MGIQANELRIGNWIADRGLKEWQIDHWEYMNKVSAKPHTTMCSGVLMETHPMTEYVDYLKPIPLTEEWLLRFGFEKKEDKEGVFYELKSNRVYLFEDGFEFEYSASGDLRFNIYKLFKHVHQLQNLFFALTNTELI